MKPFVPSMGSRTYVTVRLYVYPVLLRQIAIILAPIQRIQDQSDIFLRSQYSGHVGLHFLLCLSIVGPENRLIFLGDHSTLFLCKGAYRKGISGTFR